MKKVFFFAGNNVYRENNVDVFIPELWANESINVLVENMVAGNLVYRDFENVLARYGDVVHVAKPGELTAKRKTNADNVVIQDVSAEDVQVPLNQHIHISILIRDGEESKSFKSLVDEFLRPQVIGIARFIDMMVLGQYPRFLANVAGTLAGLDSTNAKSELLALRQVFNINKAPLAGRNLVLNPVTETAMLNLDIFTQAQMVGDQGEALRNATLGKKLGWDFWMDQNMATVAGGNTTLAGAINGGNLTKGSTVLTVGSFTGAVVTGSWITIAGEMVPHKITAHTETLGNTTSITIDPPLTKTILTAAVVTAYTPGAVNQSVAPTGYPANYAKEIVIDAFTVAPRVGQFVTFGTAAPIYSIMAVTGLTGITLDRPLDAAIADDATVNLGPPGNYNFAFHKNAVALVTRPLALPMASTGARAAVANFNNLSMRVVITYNGEKQGHLVTVDMLAGVAQLDVKLGGVLLG